jgi:uroporphyrin-III C-methyltransferase
MGLVSPPEALYTYCGIPHYARMGHGIRIGGSRENRTVNHMSGHARVHLIGAGPGDPELITLRGARLLEQAEVVLYDRLVHPALLDTVPPDALRIFVGKRCGRASVTQAEINRMMVQYARAGLRVVRLKGGDPFILGRGAEECLELARAGVPFEVVPGVSSVTAVPAYAGIPLTHRNVASGFTVISGHLHGESASHDWEALATTPTLVVLMGLRNLPEIASRLMEAGKDSETPAAVIGQGTRDDQRTIVATLADIARVAAGLEPPAVIVIGPVATYHERISWFRPGAAATEVRDVAP